MEGHGKIKNGETEGTEVNGRFNTEARRAWRNTEKFNNGDSEGTEINEVEFELKKLR